jgi:hypothetical protein
MGEFVDRSVGKVGPMVLDLLQVATMLALPMLVVGALLWLVAYSSVRVAIRHEVTRLEQRKATAERARARGRPEAAAPRLVRAQTARTTAQARTQPLRQRPSDRAEPVATGARRRSAS